MHLNVGENDDLPVDDLRKGFVVVATPKPDIAHLLADPAIMGKFVSVSLGAPEDVSKMKTTHLAIFADGVYQSVTTGVGQVIQKVSAFEKKGFPPQTADWVEGFHPNHPLIPANLLYQVWAFFREISEKHSAEVYVSIWWDPETETYRVEVPEQTVSGSRVEHLQDSPNISGQQIMQIHSHVKMSAFWSNVDDADEEKQGNLIFGVCGHVDWAIPESKWRVRAGNQFVDVTVGELFEFENYTVTHNLNGESLVTGSGTKDGITPQPVRFRPIEKQVVPPEWAEKVKTSKVTSVGGSAYQFKSGWSMQPRGREFNVGGKGPVETWWEKAAREHLEDGGDWKGLED